MNTPHQIDRYEILSELGVGGMAVVYLAYDPVFKREVALKILSPRFMHDPEFRSRFVAEARLIARLEHNAIVPVYDYGISEDLPFLVTQYMPGGALSNLLRRGPLTLHDTSEHISRVAAALDKAHEAQVIHRDIKPDNILLDAEGMAYLADFGIARLAEVTSTVTVTGTPAYMAPEQALGSGIDARTDVYQLGVAIFQLLTNQMPYSARSFSGLLYEHANAPIPSACAINEDLPPTIDGLLSHALAKKPEQRYETAGELARTLHEAAAGKPISQVVKPQRSQWDNERNDRAVQDAKAKPSKRFYAMSVLIILVIMAVLGFTFSKRSSAIEQQTVVVEDPTAVVTGNAASGSTEAVSRLSTIEVTDYIEAGLQLTATGTPKTEVTGLITASPSIEPIPTVATPIADPLPENSISVSDLPNLPEDPSLDAVVQMAEVGSFSAVEDSSVEGISRYALLWSLDNSELGVFDGNSTLHFFNVEDSSQSRSIEFDLADIRGDTVTLSPDGQTIATVGIQDSGDQVSSEYRLRYWDAASGQNSQEFYPFSQSNYLSWSPNGAVISSGGDNNDIYLLNAQNGEAVEHLETDLGTVLNLDWSPTGQFIAAGGSNRKVELWDVNSAENLLHRLSGHSWIINSVRWRPDGQEVATASLDGVRLWDPISGDFNLKFGANVTDMAWSPGGRYLAVAGTDGVVRLWDRELEQEVHTLEGHNDVVQKVAWSPNGELLASISKNGFVRLWGIPSETS